MFNIMKKLSAMLAVCALFATGPAQAAYDLTTFDTGASGGGSTAVSSNLATMVTTSWISKAVYNVTSFDWNFTTTDYMPYNDYAYVSLDGSQSTLSNVAALGNLIGNTSSTGWQTVTFASAFTGLLEFGVVNAIDSLYDSTLQIQNVAVVPEPETYAMLLVGLCLIGFMARRREENFNF